MARYRRRGSIGLLVGLASTVLLATTLPNEVAGSSLEPTHISTPLRTSLRRTQVIRGRVTAIDLDTRHGDGGPPRLDLRSLGPGPRRGLQQPGPPEYPATGICLQDRARYHPPSQPGGGWRRGCPALRPARRWPTPPARVRRACHARACHGSRANRFHRPHTAAAATVHHGEARGRGQCHPRPTRHRHSADEGSNGAAYPPCVDIPVWCPSATGQHGAF